MQECIIALGSMSLQAGVVIVIALVFRKLFDRLHIAKKYMMLFWLIPFFCLVCPWKFSASVGFWQASPADIAAEGIIQEEGKESWQPVQDAADREFGQQNMLSENPGMGSGKNAVPEHEKEGIKQNAVLENQSRKDEEQVLRPAEDGQTEMKGRSVVSNWFSSSPVTVRIAGGIWLLGFLALFTGNIVCCVRLKQRLLCSIKIEKNVYMADEIGSPVVVGFFRPRIYLSPGLLEENRTYVLEHERTHIRRGDMFFKMAVYIITCIHWFNPLVWYGFYLFGKDMEMACDEETVKRIGIEEREAYAKTLLDVAEGSAMKNKIIFAAPMAFEEGEAASRIKNIMKYRKTAALLAVCAVAVCILAGGLFFTKVSEKPVQKHRIGEAGKTVSESVLVKPQDGGKKIQGDGGKAQYFVWIRQIQDGMLENFQTVSTEDLGIDSVFKDCDGLDFSLGYEFVDLDSDGMYELLLGGNIDFPDSKNPIYGIYGLRDGQVVPVLEKEEGDRIFLCENDVIVKETYQTDKTGRGQGRYNCYFYYTYGNRQMNLIEMLSYDNSQMPAEQWTYCENGKTEEAVPVNLSKVQEVQKKYGYKNLFFQILMKKEKIQKAREAEALQAEYPDEENLNFSDLSGVVFHHESGVGAWHTELIIKPDGSFEGFYQDGEALSGYHYNYTEYECYFSGKFSNLKKTGAYEYTMKCTEFQAEGTIGEEHIEGETRVIDAEPYGFLNADEVRLYLPGKQEKDLPDEYLDWCGADLEYGVLTSYGLFNVGDGSGYIVYPDSEPVYKVGYEHTMQPVEIPKEVLSEEELADLRKKYPDREDFNFSGLVGKEFWCPRIGGTTWLMIEEDGTFYVRKRSNINEQEVGEGYPKGTIYNCILKGKFTNLRKADSYKYTMKCKYLEMEPAGKEWIEDGYRYITVKDEILGFEKSEEFQLYLPGARVTKLPEGHFRWSYDYDRTDDIIRGYYLYNVGTETTFYVPEG